MNRLGFIGAPLATAISFNLVSIMSLTYGIWIERDIKRRRREILEQEAREAGNGHGNYGATSGSDARLVQSERDGREALMNKDVLKKLPKSAWYPISFRSFTSLGPLVELGLGGVGKFPWSNAYWATSTDATLTRSNRLGMVGMGTYRSGCCSTGTCHPRCAVCVARICECDLPSTICLGCWRKCSVGCSCLRSSKLAHYFCSSKTELATC